MKPAKHQTALTERQAADRIIEAMRVGTPLSFLVGAGVSYRRPAGLPGWELFRDELLRVLGSHLVRCGFLRSGESDVVVDELLTVAERVDVWLKPEVVLKWLQPHMRSELTEALQLFSGGRPNLNHLVLVSAAKLGNVRLATTNFDTLIERACDVVDARVSVYASRRSVATCRSFLQYHRDAGLPPDTVRLLKLHGSTACPTSIRATIDEIFLKVTAAERKAVRDLVDHRLIVVAGYSGRDAWIVSEIADCLLDSVGVLWMTRDARKVPPGLSDATRLTIVEGDIDRFFDELAADLSVTMQPEADLSEVAVRSHLVDSVESVDPVAAAVAMGELAAHVGARTAVDKLGEQVIQESQYAGYVVDAWMFRGDALRRHDPEKALDHFMQAELAARKIRSTDPSRYAHALKYIAAQYYVLGDAHLEEALRWNTRCLRWVDKTRDQGLRGRVLDDRAIIFRQRGNLRHAIRLRREAIALLAREGDVTSLAYAYNNLGRDYDVQNRFDQAEEYWRKSLELKLRQTSASPDVARTSFNLGELLRHRGRLTEARHRLERAQAAAALNGDRVVEARALFSLAALATSLDDQNLGRRLLERADAKAGEAPDWYGHRGRVRWAEGIRTLVGGDGRSSRAT